MVTFDEFKEEIERYYNKANLDDIYENILKGFVIKHLELVQQKGIDTTELSGKKKPVKAVLSTVFASVLHDKAVFASFRDSLPAPLPQVWEKLLLEGVVLHTALEKEFAVKIATVKGAYASDPTIDPLYAAFKYQVDKDYYGYLNEKKMKVLFYLPPVMKRHLLSLLDLPEEYVLKPVPEPTGASFVYQDEDGILDELPLFLAYYQQGEIKYTNSGKPLASSINKMRKFCNSREFFPDDKSQKELVNLRAQLITEALPLAGNVKQLTMSVPELLQRIVKNFAAGELSVLYSLLFHLKGSGFVKNNYEVADANDELVTILKNLPAGQWFNFDNLRRHVTIFYEPLMPVNYYVAKNYLYLEVIATGAFSTYKDKYELHQGIYADTISIPLLKTAMFFFAALGLADVAYDYPANELAKELGRDYLSVWDGLRYVRLTPLGAFVLGQTSTYEAPVREKSGELYLEEDRLLINYTGDDKITAMMLEKVAAKSTATRYKVDYQSFLKDCTSKKDIENKIGVFREHIEAKPPQVWEDFFTELLNKYNPFKKESKLKVFQIPSDNKELISLLARDEVLKKLVIKAEQYYILVEEKNMGAVRARLEKFGFLLERGK